MPRRERTRRMNILARIKGLQKKDFSHLKCFSCDKKEHLAEECRKKKEWKDDMIKKYQLIMWNDVWRLEGKFCNIFQVDLQDQAYSRWKYQEIQSKVRGFSQKEGVDYGKALL